MPHGGGGGNPALLGLNQYLIFIGYLDFLVLPANWSCDYANFQGDVDTIFFPFSTKIEFYRRRETFEYPIRIIETVVGGILGL